MPEDGINPVMEVLQERWLWISAGLIAAAIVGLTIAYYVKHPERDIWSDFAQRNPLGSPRSNGHVPDAAARVGVDVAEGS